MAIISVVLADDHAVLRSGLRLMLNTQEDMEVVGEAADGEAAVRLCRETKPDIVLLDLNMPGLSGLDAIEEIKQDNPGTKILVLTMQWLSGNYPGDLALGIVKVAKNPGSAVTCIYT